MAEHTIETRILLRYDTLSNWMTSTTILKRGEVAIAQIPYGTTLTSSDHTPENTPPAIGLKVGDGESYFYELPWVQGVAGDVYTWAKQRTKPVYTADEIQDLATFIEEHTSGGGGSGGSDTPVAARIYQLVQGTGVNANKFYLQYRTADSNEWTIDTAHYIDLSSLAKIVNWIGDDLEDYYTLYGRIYDGITTELRKIDVDDSYEEGKVVVAVNQTNGVVSAEKRILSLNNFTGPLLPELGGTGLTTIAEDNILVGTRNNTFTTKSIEAELDNTTNLATNRAIKAYVDDKTAGLTGAMHYIGEATVEINPAVNAYINPQISGYDFSRVQMGDVITSNQKEFVWAGSWHLLGDEGSYAVKGSIINADISTEAAIDQSKIADLVEDLASKVTIIEGKGLSTNDYTNEEKEKLEYIETGAQVNTIEHILVNDIEAVPNSEKIVNLTIPVLTEEQLNVLNIAQANTIEHIFVNGVESAPQIINDQPKSVNIEFTPFTQIEKEKLAGIEAGAQVNTIESISINGTECIPDNNKAVEINFTALEGAQYLNGLTYTDINIINQKLELSKIAATGNIDDLIQTTNYVTFYCGTSREVI